MNKFKSISIIFIISFFMVCCSSLPTEEVSLPSTITKIITSSKTSTITFTATSTNKPSRTKVPTYTPKPTNPSNTPLPNINATIVSLPSPELHPDCGTVTLGYPGTQTWEMSHKIILTGSAILCADVFLFENQLLHVPIYEGFLDLDTGRVGQSKDADIEYDESGGNMLWSYIFSVNDAEFISWAYLFDYPPEPTYQECVDKVDTYHTDNSPTYLCVTTTEGNISRVKVEEYRPLGKNDQAIRISFITWEP